ncbi:MAG TPA: M20/M25/M40 family metallo-hydrolase, partial [Pirellulales bacterium]|nr:M20/M25/M40 family metallo-hydrolase [Pirellulales bacterium]
MSRCNCARGAFFLVLPCLCLCHSAWAVENSSRTAALESITTEEVKTHIDALADDTFEGRESGSRGGRAAATYIVRSLKKCGYHGAAPKDSFYQNFRDYHNILTQVEGRDPQLKDQFIVIGAHYDHVGYGSALNSYGPLGKIHNGADDNASGVAALLEVAEALSRLAEPPRRSVLIAFWDGEEKGLLGSEYWAAHPTVPLGHVPIVINADMVGRLRAKLEIFGSRTSVGLRKLVSRQNEVPQLPIDFNWQMKPDSDHHSFFKRDIPILMFFTGMHGDYHRPSDDADKINTTGVQHVAQLMFGVLVELADAPDLGSFRRRSKSESRVDQEQREIPLPQLPGRLGITWSEEAAKKGEIIVATVALGSAAERAGIRRGDRITQFAGHDVHGAAAFRLMVVAAQNPVAAVLRR